MDLFNQPEQLSPMEEWRVRHSVGVYETQSGWRASSAAKTAHGADKESALLAWADKIPKTPCWKSEELEKLKVKGAAK